jgi:hypothetical protein
MKQPSQTPLKHHATPYYVKPSKSDLASLHTASTLVINCVDFRWRDEVSRFLNDTLNLQDQYDEIALPGASLAFVTKDKPHWTQTIDDVIDIVKKLHNIQHVIFIDHMGCGAYRALLGDSMKDDKVEKQAHINTFQQAREKMARSFSTLQVSTWLLGLDGNIEEYGPHDQEEE